MSSDFHTVVVEHTSHDSEDTMMHQVAQGAAEILNRHYPNHLFAIGWAPGLTLVIKLMSAPAAEKYGYTIDMTKICSQTDAAVKIMRAGGELLERAGLKRGAWDGQFATKLDGAAANHLPPAHLLGTTH
jgi:hypothetical protein